MSNDKNEKKKIQFIFSHVCLYSYALIAATRSFCSVNCKQIYKNGRVVR